MLSYFQDTVAGIEARLTELGPGEPRARKKLALETARLGVRLFSGIEPVAWCGVLAPFDVLNAMGLASCYVEFVGTTLAATGAGGQLQTIAEQAGYSTDSCSYHRTVLGAMLSGGMPEPELVIATSAPCTGGVAVSEEMARHFGKEMFVLHVPQTRSQAAVDELACNLELMVDFVSASTDKTLDAKRFSQAIDCSNRTRGVLVETFALARSVPSPARPRDLINLGLSVALLYGTEAGVEVAEAYRDEFSAKLRAGGLPKEKLRLMWLQNRIQFSNRTVAILGEQFSAAVVVDEFNPITWEAIDPEDPYPGLARRILSIPLCGGLDYRLEHLKKLATDYQIDGAINPCHWGCRQGTGSRGLVERALREVGVPVLNLEVDCVDERNFSEGQTKTRLEAFAEMLLERRAAAAN